jgi:hypothetical protein
MFRHWQIRTIFSASLFCLVMLSASIQAEFAVVVDPGLKADPATIPAPGQGSYTVGVIADPAGRMDQFVEGEVILLPASPQQRDAFLDRWQGQIASDGTIPAPPQAYQYLQRNIPSTSGYLRIRVDSALVDTQQILENGKQLGLDGTYRLSSPAMLQLFALFLEERNAGRLGLDLNGVFSTRACVADSSQEIADDASAPNPALVNEGYRDAFATGNYNDPDVGVTEAWQLSELFGITPGTVPLCLIDIGFVINDDFPTVVPYDFVDEDRDVDADERSYHGTRTLSVASARLDDRFGFAGTGGPAALPMPFRFDLTFHQGAWAIRTAVSWGAEVINMSWGGTCDWWCDTFGGLSGENAVNEALDEASAHGVVTVAAAGNDETDLDTVYDLPSEGGTSGAGNIVVGALDLPSKEATRTVTHDWGSNYGSVLDTWIPVSPRIPSTPTPSSAPDLSRIGMTSGASAYTAGVITLMKAMAPSLTVAEIHAIIEDSNRASPDTRVATGYLDVYGAAYRAASSAAAIDPPDDPLEPNDHSDFLYLAAGDYCANLHEGDNEDGYWFWVDDIRPVQVDVDGILMGNYTATLSGFGLDSRVTLPYNGTLVPGGYYVRLTRIPPDAAFYELSLDIGAPSTMAPDRFEINDTLATAAALNFPGYRVGDTWTVDDINYHVPGDPDYFALQLPPLTNPLYTDRLSLWFEPNEDGYSSVFDCAVYDATGATVAISRGPSVTIENVRADFPDGEVRFLVQDGMGRRNHYRMIIGYDQYPRGVAPPGGFAFPDIPTWIPDPSDFHLLHVPELALEGIRLDLPFPGDPTLIEQIAIGQAPQTIPDEILILRWPQREDFDLQISYVGNPQAMGFTLIGQQGETLAVASPIVPPGTENDGITRLAIALPRLQAGIYGIRVSGTAYPVPYSLALDIKGRAARSIIPAIMTILD